MVTNQYAYNGDGQRVQVIDSQGTKKQIWDGENVLLETDGSNVTQVVYTNEPAGYVNLLSQRRGSTTNFYLYDALGSTRKLVNSAGTITDSYDYRAYGETFASSGTTVNVFRWVGKKGYYFDVDRSAYYVRARHYSPKQGRWISQDPIGFEGSEWNLFEYSHSRPSLVIDPSGQSGFCDNDCPQQQPGDITRYGCYCGEGNLPGPGPGPPRPIDPLDALCRDHDKCYGDVIDPPCRGRIIWNPLPEYIPDPRRVCRECDRIFCRRLNSSRCNRYGVGTPEYLLCAGYASRARVVFKCHDLGL